MCDGGGRTAPAAQISAATATSSAPSSPGGSGADVLGPLADLHADQVGAERDPDRDQRIGEQEGRGCRPDTHTRVRARRRPRSCRTWRRWETRRRCRSSRRRSRGSRASVRNRCASTDRGRRCPGYLTESAATAMASGTMNKHRGQQPERDRAGTGVRRGRNPARADDAGDGEEREIAQAEFALQLRGSYQSMQRARFPRAVRCRCGAVLRAGIRVLPPSQTRR